MHYHSGDRVRIVSTSSRHRGIVGLFQRYSDTDTYVCFVELPNGKVIRMLESGLKKL